jgi:hypothetical protein
VDGFKDVAMLEADLYANLLGRQGQGLPEDVLFDVIWD